MDLFKLQLIYHHALLSRALLLRLLLLSAAVAVLPFLARDPPDSTDAAGCGGSDTSPSISPAALESVLLDLLSAGYLPLGGQSLCLGPAAAAASAAMALLGTPPGRAAVAACGVDLPFADASFDFVLAAGGLDGARSPARVAMEMERVLATGGTGVVLAAGPPARPRSLVRTVAPVAAMLRASDVVAVRTVNASAVVVVVFRRKRAPTAAAAW